MKICWADVLCAVPWVHTWEKSTFSPSSVSLQGSVLGKCSLVKKLLHKMVIVLSELFTVWELTNNWGLLSLRSLVILCTVSPTRLTPSSHGQGHYWPALSHHILVKETSLILHLTNWNWLEYQPVNISNFSVHRSPWNLMLVVGIKYFLDVKCISWISDLNNFLIKIRKLQ